MPSEKPGCYQVLVTKYWSHCLKSIVMLILIAVELFWFSFAFRGGVFIFVGIVVMCWFYGFFSCVRDAYSTAEKEMNNTEDLKWYSLEEAQMFLNNLSDKEVTLNHRIICYEKKSGVTSLALDESEKIEYRDWVNLSQDVEIGGSTCFGIRKVYIVSTVEPADRLSANEIEAGKLAFLDARKNIGTSFKYSDSVEHSEIPKIILVTNKSRDNKPVIPWFYSQRIIKLCNLMKLGVFWQLFLENVLSSHYIYHNRNAISASDISEELKREIEDIRKGSKFKL